MKTILLVFSCLLLLFCGCKHCPECPPAPVQPAPPTGQSLPADSIPSPLPPANLTDVFPVSPDSLNATIAKGLQVWAEPLSDQFPVPNDSLYYPTAVVLDQKDLLPDSNRLMIVMAVQDTSEIIQIEKGTIDQFFVIDIVIKPPVQPLKFQQLAYINVPFGVAELLQARSEFYAIRVVHESAEGTGMRQKKGTKIIDADVEGEPQQPNS